MKAKICEYCQERTITTKDLEGMDTCKLCREEFIQCDWCMNSYHPESMFHISAGDEILDVCFPCREG